MKKYQKISPFLIFWPHGQSVKTSPFHGGVRGSTPAKTALLLVFAFFKSEKLRPNICFRLFAPNVNSRKAANSARLRDGKADFLNVENKFRRCTSDFLLA